MTLQTRSSLGKAEHGKVGESQVLLSYWGEETISRTELTNPNSLSTPMHDINRIKTTDVDLICSSPARLMTAKHSCPPLHPLPWPIIISQIRTTAGHGLRFPLYTIHAHTPGTEPNDTDSSGSLLTPPTLRTTQEDLGRTLEATARRGTF